MHRKELINEINSLPINEKIFIIEKLIKSIKEELPQKSTISKAAKLMKSEYTDNSDLTSFMVLDQESFYETK